MFYRMVTKLCADHGVSLSNLAEQIGLTRSAASGWKAGSIPRPSVLKKIADYFNVTVDYLLGNEEIPVAMSRDNGYEGLTEEQIEMIEIMKEEFRQRNINKSGK